LEKHKKSLDADVKGSLLSITNEQFNWLTLTLSSIDHQQNIEKLQNALTRNAPVKTFETGTSVITVYR